MRERAGYVGNLARGVTVSRTAYGINFIQRRCIKATDEKPVRRPVASRRATAAAAAIRTSPPSARPPRGAPFIVSREYRGIPEFP